MPYFLFVKPQCPAVLPSWSHSSPRCAFNATGRNTLTWRSAGRMSEWGTLCSCSVTRSSQQTSCCSTPLTRTGSATWRPPTSTGRPTSSSAASWQASAARSVWGMQPTNGHCCLQLWPLCHSKASAPRDLFLHGNIYFCIPGSVPCGLCASVAPGTPRSLHGQVEVWELSWELP